MGILGIHTDIGKIQGLGSTHVSFLFSRIAVFMTTGQYDEIVAGNRITFADGDNVFVSRVYTGESNGCADDPDESAALCAFDDIVKWVSPALLNNRMVVAGRLP